LIAQLGGAVPESRENQMRLAAMKPPTLKRRPRLDEQHALVDVVDKMRAQLVGEAPAPSLRARPSSLSAQCCSVGRDEGVVVAGVVVIGHQA